MERVVVSFVMLYTPQPLNFNQSLQNRIYTANIFITERK